jgi:hypothetical protein
MSSGPDRKHEQLCATIRDENAKLLAGFSRWLSDRPLRKKAIRQHVRDVELFINTFLLTDGTTPARCGVNRVAAFLGDWFIRNSIGADPNSLLGQAASLKTFYTFLNEERKTTDDELREMRKTITLGMPGWLAMVGFSRPKDDEPPEM